MREWTLGWLGWIFCEASFRLWDIAGDHYRLIDWAASPLNTLGNRMYRRAYRL